MMNRVYRVTETGDDIYKQEKIPHFDYDAGVSFFSEKNEIGAKQESFKRGPLRLVQYRLCRDYITRTRDQKKTDVPVSEMPANVSDRLFYLRDNGFTSLPNSDVESLADIYQYFLWQAYRSAANYHNTGSSVTEFNRAEVRERRQDLLSLTANPLL